MLRTLLIVAGGILVFGLGASIGVSREAAKDRFYELRIYTTHEGKLDDLHKRFRDHTNRLFKKHGMQLVGYWTPTEEKKSKNTLVYILAYPDKASRDKSWKGFVSDPEWQAAYKASHKNGKIVKKVVSQYLKPTDYSPLR